jgi:glycine dehydrogenase subunit 2
MSAKVMETREPAKAHRGYRIPEPSIFELSQPGCVGYSLPEPPADADADLPRELLREDDLAGLPEASEPEVMRHFTRMSQRNYGIDTGLFPLGSCTMKHNPRLGEWAARLDGFAGIHPRWPEGAVQGALALLWAIERALAEVSGFSQVTLQPAAGAQGELVGLMMIRKALAKRGERRRRVLVPASAHGTNPASATLNGYETQELQTGADGVLTPDIVAAAMDGEVAAVMITNPNTLGVFEPHIAAVAEVVHAKGGLVYCDGANMNALLGHARPGDMGVDVMQFNLHKTFSTPHGGGGPGVGPVGVAAALVPHLPRPVVVRRADGRYGLDGDRPESVGRLSAHNGQFGLIVRAYSYMRELGPEGLKRAAAYAVLNANYIRARLAGAYALASKAASMHEVVFSDATLKPLGVKTLDVAKRLIDYGFHPPTVYFPLIVSGAMMIEPTETETKRELDAFCEAMLAILEDARRDPELLRQAPHHAPVRRLDETRAARRPVLTHFMERSGPGGSAGTDGGSGASGSGSGGGGEPG